MGAWVPYIPDRAQVLGLNTAQLGTTLLAGGVGAVLAMPLAGWLISAAGSRRVSTFAGALFPMALAAAVLAPTAPAILIALLLFGFSGASMDIAMNAQGVMVEEQLQRRVISGLHGIFSLGCLAGSVATSVALARHVPPGALAVRTALVLALAVLLFHRSLLPKAQEIVNEGAKPARPDAKLLALGGLVLAAMVSEGAVADWSAVYLRAVRGDGPGVVGVGFAVFSAAMLAGRFSGDRIVTWIGENRALRAGGVLGAVGGLLVVLGRGGPVSLAGFGLLGLGLANAAPVLYRAAGQTGNLPAGVGLATAVGMGYAGLMVGPPALGFAGQRFGVRIIFLIVAALCTLLALGSPMAQRTQTSGGVNR